MLHGVSMLVVGELPLEEGLERIARGGFTQVELISWDTPVGEWKKDPARMRRLLERLGLKARSVHTPDAGWDNDAPDEATRLASIEASSSVFAPSAELGVEVVVVHPNAPYTHTFTEADREASVARSVASLEVLAERAAAAGLKLAVENLPRRKTPRPGGAVAELLRMIDGLGSHVGLCLDAGHANSNGLSAAAEARAAGGRIFAVHVHDNDGLGEDQHLLPGDGTTDWPAFLAALNEAAPDCISSFEVPAIDGDADKTLVTLAAIARRWERS